MSRWLVVRVTEEDERKDVDTYVDWEGFASTEETLKLYEKWKERYRDAVKDHVKTICLHRIHQALDTWLNLEEETGEYNQKDIDMLFHGLFEIADVFYSKRTAWMSETAE